MEPISFEQHRNNFGGKCPFCLSEAVDWGSMEFFDGAIYQEAYCHDCETDYEDVYELNRYCQH
jgi:hypothetical protein